MEKKNHMTICVIKLNCFSSFPLAANILCFDIRAPTHLTAPHSKHRSIVWQAFANGERNVGEETNDKFFDAKANSVYANRILL